jgi:hypothetical protein
MFGRSRGEKNDASPRSLGMMRRRLCKIGKRGVLASMYVLRPFPGLPLPSSRPLVALRTPKPVHYDAAIAGDGRRV